MNCLKSDTSTINTTLQSNKVSSRMSQPVRLPIPLYQRHPSRTLNLNSSGDERFGSNIFSSTPLSDNRSSDNLTSSIHGDFLKNNILFLKQDQGLSNDSGNMSADNLLTTAASYFAFAPSSISATDNLALDHMDDPELQGFFIFLIT